MARAHSQYVVRGTSMEPALREGQKVRARKAAVGRGEVVVFRSSDGLDVKRVVALPGETVEIRGDELLVDGVRVARAAAKERRLWRLGHEEYFVLGDNAENSRDSRDVGPVPAQRIIGVVC